MPLRIVPTQQPQSPLLAAILGLSAGIQGAQAPVQQYPLRPNYFPTPEEQGPNRVWGDPPPPILPARVGDINRTTN